MFYYKEKYCNPMVSLFGFEIKRKKSAASPRSGYEFTEDDQIHATETKRLKAEQRRVMAEMSLARQKMELDRLRWEQQKLRDEMDDEDDDEDEDSDDDSQANALLLGILAPILSSRGAPTDPAATNNIQGVPVSAVREVNFTDDEIRQLLSEMPKTQLKIAKKLDDSTIEKFILSKQPNVSHDTVSRAIRILKTE